MKKLVISALLIAAFNSHASQAAGGVDVGNYSAGSVSGSLIDQNSPSDTAPVDAHICRMELTRKMADGKLFAQMNFQAMDTYEKTGNTTLIGQNRTLFTDDISISAAGVEINKSNPELQTMAKYENGILTYTAIYVSKKPLLAGAISRLQIKEVQIETSSDFSSVGKVRLSWKVVTPAAGLPAFISRDIQDILQTHASTSEGSVDCANWNQAQ